MYVYLLEIENGVKMICASEAVAMVEFGALRPGVEFRRHESSDGYDDAAVTGSYNGRDIGWIWKMPVMGFISF